MKTFNEYHNLTEETVSEPEPETVSVKIGTSTYQLELAETPDKQFLGLGGRTHIPRKTGMLFVMPREEIQEFCMRDCKCNMDIIYVNEDNKIVGLHTMLAERPKHKIETEYVYESRLRKYASDLPARYAIEIPAGDIARLGLKKHQSIDLSSTSLFESKEKTVLNEFGAVYSISPSGNVRNTTPDAFAGWKASVEASNQRIARQRTANQEEASRFGDMLRRRREENEQMLAAIRAGTHSSVKPRIDALQARIAAVRAGLPDPVTTGQAPQRQAVDPKYTTQNPNSLVSRLGMGRTRTPRPAPQQTLPSNVTMTDGVPTVQAGTSPIVPTQQPVAAAPQQPVSISSFDPDLAADLARATQPSGTVSRPGTATRVQDNSAATGVYVPRPGEVRARAAESQRDYERQQTRDRVASNTTRAVAQRYMDQDAAAERERQENSVDAQASRFASASPEERAEMIRKANAGMGYATPPRQTSSPSTRPTGSTTR